VSGSSFHFLELALFYGLAFGFIGQQLWSVRRAQQRDRDKDDSAP
jgi:hypothetical protein